MDTNKIRILSGAVAGALIGFAGGYILAEKLLKKRYEEIANEEIDSVKDRYKKMYKEGEYISPVSASATLEVDGEVTEGHVTPTDGNVWSEMAKAAKEMNDELGYSQDEDVPEDKFQGRKPPREDGTAYVISVDEFHANEDDHELITIRYYEGDDTLVDDAEQMIPDVEGTVGDALAWFGYQSQDENIVYVHNARIDSSFEVLLDKRGYSESVLGVKNIWDEDEKPKIRKMRPDE